MEGSLLAQIVAVLAALALLVAPAAAEISVEIQKTEARSAGPRNVVVDVEGSIARKPGSPLRAWDPYTTVSIESLGISSFVSPAGTFVLHGVPVGSHIMQVSSHKYEFPVVRVDVNPESFEVTPTHYYVGSAFNDDLGPELYSSPAIEIPQLAKRSFFLQRQGFNILDFFKNPMMLMSAFSLLMVVVGPKLMENMPTDFDEEGNPIDKPAAEKILGHKAAAFAIEEAAREPKIKQITKS